MNSLVDAVPIHIGLTFTNRQACHQRCDDSGRGKSLNAPAAKQTSGATAGTLPPHHAQLTLLHR